MEQQIRDILAEVGGLVVPVGQVKLQQDLFAAGLTSFATVTVMLALEEAFDLEFPDRLMTRATFGSIATLVAAVTELKDGRLAA